MLSGFEAPSVWDVSESGSEEQEEVMVYLRSGCEDRHVDAIICRRTAGQSMNSIEVITNLANVRRQTICNNVDPGRGPSRTVWGLRRRNVLPSTTTCRYLLEHRHIITIRLAYVAYQPAPMSCLE